MESPQMGPVESHSNPICPIAKLIESNEFIELAESTEPDSQNLRRATLSLFLSVRAVVMWGVLMWVSCPVPLVTRPRSLCRHCTLSHAPTSAPHRRPRGTCLARCADVVEVDELAHPERLLDWDCARYG